MSKTKFVLAAVAIATLSTVQVRADNPQEKEMKMCQDLTKVNAAIGNFESLNKDSTVKEAKQAADRVSDAVDKLGKSAKDVRPEQYKELADARKDLKKSLDSAPKDATIGQVQATVSTNRERVKTAYKNLESSVTCPPAATTTH
jgi:hypothetical protein